MSPETGAPKDGALLETGSYEEDALLGEEALDEEELEEPPWWSRIDPRKAAAVAAAALVALALAVPLGVLFVPAVSDAILLPRQSAGLVLALEDVPAGFRIDLDYAKLPDFGLDDSQPSLARKAQLAAFGFGGGWVRTFESGERTGLVQVATGTSVYRASEGAHREYERTIQELSRDPIWRPFNLGVSVGDEFTAYEQRLQGGHAALVYYRYANVLAQVSLTCAGSPDESFACVQQNIRELAQKQVGKERLGRLRPF